MTRWDDVGDLRRLLEPASLAALLREGGVPATGAAPDHLRLKFGVNALVGVRIETADGHLPGYVRTYADAAQAQLVAEKWRCIRVDETALGPGVRLLPGGASVLYLFPNDAQVRRLRFLYGRPRRLARLLGELTAPGANRTDLGSAWFETLRYKPERRLVGAARLVVDGEPRSVVFRLRADDADSDLTVTVARLHDALGARIPRPLGAVYGNALVVEDHVAGKALAAAVNAGEAVAAPLAEVIAALHASEVTLPQRTDAPDVLRRALAGLDQLGGVDPTITLAVTQLHADLVAAMPPPGPSTPLHGDLHLDQVILAPAGPVVLDFERAALGPAAHDLGSIVAHLRADGHDAFAATFLDAYARTRVVDTAALAFFVGCALVQRALLAFRSLHPARRELVPHLLSLAHEELHGRSPWDVTFPRRSGLWPAWTATGGVRRHGRFDPVGRTLVDAGSRDDDALPGLGPLLVDGGTLIAYRPGQRAVVRVEGVDGIQFVKVIPPRRAGRVVIRARAVARVAGSTPGFPVLAEIVDAHVEHGTVAFAELPGPTLRDLLLAGIGADSLPAVAGAVAAFQSAAVPEEIGEGSTSGLEGWVGFVSAHAPALTPSYERVLWSLPDPPGGNQPALAHGDLHDGNLVVGDAGIGVLDLDGATAADPAEDVGNLVAHLVLRAFQRGDGAERGHEHGELLLAAYHAAGGVAGREAVTTMATRALFRLACVYHFRGRWRTLAPRLLHEAAVAGHREAAR